LEPMVSRGEINHQALIWTQQSRKGGHRTSGNIFRWQKARQDKTAQAAALLYTTRAAAGWLA